MTASTETPEQAAREIADKHTRGRQPAQALLLLDIEAAIRAAIAAEREACAKVVERWSPASANADAWLRERHLVAGEIRSRP